MRDHLLRRFIALRHRQQHEKLVVRRRPRDVARARAQFRRRSPAGEPEKRRRVRVEIASAVVHRVRPVAPHRADIHPVVVRTHRRGRADDPFLRGQRERPVRGVLQAHARVDEII